MMLQPERTVAVDAAAAKRWPPESAPDGAAELPRSLQFVLVVFIRLAIIAVLQTPTVLTSRRKIGTTVAGTIVVGEPGDAG